MEELTLDGEKYISSKHAAKITGYAKDYVGQLCREGRVKARLVGRGWYVLEDSIREHRFGNNIDKDIEVPQYSNIRYSNKQEIPEIHYSTEKVIPIQNISTKYPDTHKETSHVGHDTHNLSVMQDTWHEWFSTPHYDNKHNGKILDLKSEIMEQIADKTNGIKVSSDGNIQKLNQQQAVPLGEYEENVAIRIKPQQEFIHHHTLPEKETEQSYNVRIRENTHRYDKKLPQSTHSDDHARPYTSTSTKQHRKYRIINIILLLIALLIGSFTIASFSAEKHGYAPNVFWSGIDHISGVRIFINK